MTPKEKADELVNRHLAFADAEENNIYYSASQSALITVDEIIPLLNTRIDEITATLFWEKVREELNMM